MEIEQYVYRNSTCDYSVALSTGLGNTMQCGARQAHAFRELRDYAQVVVSRAKSPFAEDTQVQIGRTLARFERICLNTAEMYYF